MGHQRYGNFHFFFFCFLNPSLRLKHFFESLCMCFNLSVMIYETFDSYRRYNTILTKEGLKLLKIMTKTSKKLKVKVVNVCPQEELGIMLQIFSCEHSSRNANVCQQSVSQSVCDTYLFVQFTRIFYNS